MKKQVQIRPAFSTPGSFLAFILFSLLLFSSPFLLSLKPGLRSEMFRFSLTENADLEYWGQQLYHEKSDLEWVFIGPCTVWWHIHPDQIEQEIEKKTGQKIRAITLGHNHFAPEVGLFLIEELLKNRKVKNIVLPTPRFNDADTFPHPDSHYWWQYGEDSPLLTGLGVSEKFKLYSSTVVGSIRNLALLFRTPTKSRPTPLTDAWGSHIRISDNDSPIKPQSLKTRPDQLIYASLPKESISNIPLSKAHQMLFQRQIELAQSKGVKVWLLSSPLKEDFGKEEIQERENWNETLKSPVPVMGVAPRLIRQVYSQDEIAGFFSGDNLSVTFSRIWSQWIAEAIGSTYAK